MLELSEAQHDFWISTVPELTSSQELGGASFQGHQLFCGLLTFLPQLLWHWTSVCVTWGWEKKATQCHEGLKHNTRHHSSPELLQVCWKPCGLLASEARSLLFAASRPLPYQPGEAAAVWAPLSHFLRRTVSSPDGQLRPRHCSGSFAQPME